MNDRSILITGAASGIGRGLAELASRDGARVIVPSLPIWAIAELTFE